MQYMFAFPEDYRTASGAVSWTMRQVAVFHRYDPSGAGNLWVFLHTNPNPKAQGCIEEEISRRCTGERTGEDWFGLHLSILSAYLYNWRWYLRHLGDEVEKLVR